MQSTRQLILSSRVPAQYEAETGISRIDLSLLKESGSLPFDDRMFDTIVFEDGYDALIQFKNELQRIMKAGGKLRLTIPILFTPQQYSPSSFWQCVSQFTDTFDLLDFHAYEMTGNEGATNILFDFSNPTPREGLLVASLKKGDYQPGVTIIIPMFNAGATIVECLTSIQALRYPSKQLEVIIVDNGSTDNSVELAKQFGFTILSETGIHTSYAARNKGILAAKGELIAFTDSDCIVTPYWLNHLVRSWNDASIGCFAGEIKAYQPKTAIEKFSERANLLGQIHTLESSYLPFTQTANSAYRKEIFTQIGLFHSIMESGGDADISWRMQKQLGLRIELIPEAYVYHKHRSTIAGLYRQFKRYERGKFQLFEQYPDYPLPTLQERKNEFQIMYDKAKQTFSKKLLMYLNDNIDVVELMEPFLHSLIRHAAYSVQKQRRRTIA